MSDNATDDFKFFPRPEAHASRWDSLLPPVQDAVRDLLLRIRGATETVGFNKKREDNQRENADVLQDVANCFLIYGDRGTGKTTVLCNAKEALGDPNSFFHPADKESMEPKKKSAKECAEKLGKVVWLDVLDLEPLPPKANMLTSVLTRVRDALDALDAPGADDATPMPQGPSSLFEESAESARHKLHRLINDATLMWEDISENDTRSRANRQVAAADIYAHFRKQFVAALSTLSSELGMRRFGRGVECPIVLPIDNIDRSTDHLHAIVKLAQMVDCRYLWLVMAGDRVDVDTFLERAYWKELIRTDGGLAASGKRGPKGEDESFVMARRQAAAASQKLLPPSHRIKVRRVRPRVTLNFCPSSNCRSAGDDRDTQHANSFKDWTIAKLLREIPIPTEEIPIATKNKGRELNFLDLLDAGKLLDDPDKERPHLTYAAEYGLWLPARGVLDLWQLAHWVVSDHGTFPIPVAKAKSAGKTKPKLKREPDLRAEKIARTMLRNVIAPSKLTSKVGKRIQDQIVRRNVLGGTVLDFSDVELKLLRTTRSTSQFHLSTENLPVDKASYLSVDEANYAVRSGLSFHDIVGHVINLEWQEQSNDSGEPCDRVQTEELPLLVVAWLMILHDIVVWAPESAVVSNDVGLTAPVVRATHEVEPRSRSARKSGFLRWPAPHWGAYVAHDAFWLRWRRAAFIMVPNQALAKVVVEGDLFRHLACLWVECALETFSKFVLKDISLKAEFRKDSLTNWLSDTTRKKKKTVKLDVQKYEMNAMKAACELYKDLRIQKDQQSSQEGASVFDDQTEFMANWLERQLPLLFTHLYVPTAANASNDEPSRIQCFLDPVKWEELTREPGEIPKDEAPKTDLELLFQCWIDNSPFILNDFEQELEKLITVNGEPQKAEDLPDRIDWKQLGPFGDLHRALKDTSEKPS